MGAPRYFGQNLVNAVQSGQVSEARIDVRLIIHPPGAVYLGTYTERRTWPHVFWLLGTIPVAVIMVLDCNIFAGTSSAKTLVSRPSTSTRGTQVKASTLTCRPITRRTFFVVPSLSLMLILLPLV